VCFTYLVGKPSFPGFHQITASIPEIDWSRNFDKLRMIRQKGTIFGGKNEKN